MKKQKKTQKKQKSRQEWSSGLYFWFVTLQVCFWSFWEALFFWRKCESFSFLAKERSNNCLENFMFDLQICLAQVQKMSKKCLLSYHIVSFNTISYDERHDITWYPIIWYHDHMISIWYYIVWCDMIWHRLISYDIIWYDIVWWYGIIWQPRLRLSPRPRPCDLIENHFVHDAYKK